MTMQQPFLPILAACALASLPGLAVADDNKPVVNFYGAADVGVEYQKYGNQSRTAVVSGTNWGSYLGVSASKNLNNGLSVGAVVEAGVQWDSGRTDTMLENSSGIYARQAKVDLNGPWGRIGVGRQYSPYFWLAIMTDPDLLGAYSPTLQVAMGHPLDTWPYGRVSNSVSYKTPNFGGLTSEINVAFGENGANNTESQTANVMYMNEKVIAGVAYQHQRLHASNPFNPTGKAVNNNLLQVAGSYNFGPVKIHASYNGFDSDRGYRSNGYALSLSAPIGKHSLFVSAAKRDDNRSKRDATGILLGYNHNLDDSVQLWTRIGAISNQSNADYSLNYANYESNFKAGDNSQGVAVGVLYKF